ncbi:MAG: hypothetical protein Athens071416_160 [Parcubacteria group bacterium Athens0714_16]|nr:MAG: hypothetical protein Athens071416_160 [Parcubacteria group bacterium Athens0714_16]
MSTIILYHHLGLGDHIMCSGIVREYCKKYDRVAIFSKSHNYPTVSFMYRDLKNITVIKGDDAFARKFISDNTSKFSRDKYDQVRLLGFQHLDRHSGIPLEWQFHQIAGVPFEKKWSNFFIKRDFEKEQRFFEQVAPQREYVFLHEDVLRKCIIKRKLINKDYIIFTPDIKFTNNIIDYCTIIEKAKEIHVIDSSFMFLIDCLPYNNPNQKLYVHRYARENNEWQLPILKKDWHILITEPSRLDPLKNFLERFSNFKMPILRQLFFKRVIRKIFRTMGWIMGRPKQTNVIALIRRYVPGKSFIVISPEKDKNNMYVSTAKIMGTTKATIVDLNTEEKITPADIIFCSSIFSENSNPLDLFKKLRLITNQILIFNTTSILKTSNKKTKGFISNDIKSMLMQTGFEIREEHILPLDACFVCRAILIK